MSKLVVLSLLSFGTVWSARNYRALRHQRTINQHRHKALMTFQTFAEGGETPQHEGRGAARGNAVRVLSGADGLPEPTRGDLSLVINPYPLYAALWSSRV